MKKQILIFSTLILGLAIPFEGNRMKASAQPFSDEDLAEKKELMTMRKQIILSHLLNTLNLTNEQSQAIIGEAKRAKEVRDTYKAKAGRLEPDAVETFKAYRDELVERGGVEERTGMEAQRTNDEIKDLRKGYKDDMDELGKRVEEILTESQVTALESYKPCLVPGKDKTDPARSGQAKPESRLEKILEKIHKAPAAVYENRKMEIIGKAIEKLEQHKGTMSEDEKQAESSRLSSVLDKTRSMSDEEFALNRKEIAKEFLGKEPDQPGEGGKTAKLRMLLDEKIIGLLEKRIDLSDGKALPYSNNLSKTAKVEYCETGTCKTK